MNTSAFPNSPLTPQAAQSGPKLEPCPVCGKAAKVLDWRPSVPWLAVEDCACDGVFVWTALLDTRLPALSPENRGTLSLRVRSVRKMGTEA